MSADTAAVLVDGLLTGAVYALMATGFTLIYAVTRLLNLAHGSLLVLGMLLGWMLAAKLGIDPYASLPLITLVLFATGYALHAGVIQPVSRGRQWVAILLTIGIAAALEALVYAVLGGAPRAVVTPYAQHVAAVGPLLVEVPRLAAAAVAVLVGGMLFVFMTRTDTGRAIRAVASEPVAACLVGIRPARMRALAYGVGTACLGAASCMLLPGNGVRAQAGPYFLLVSVTAAVLGGLGSMKGAIAGGLVVGVAESLGTLVLGEAGGPLATGAVLLAAALLRASRLRRTVLLSRA